MRELFFLILTTVLVNNVVLVKFLGLCSFMGVTRQVSSGLSMGLATTFVITLSCAGAWILENWVLLPLGMGYMRILAFILVIAALVQFVELVIRKSSPVLYQVLGIFLPLITTNCAVLGLTLINAQEKTGFVTSTLTGFGASLGFTMIMVIFAGMREKLAFAKVPKTFAGMPIGFVTASLLALAFMGFSGLSPN